MARKKKTAKQVIKYRSKFEEFIAAQIAKKTHATYESVKIIYVQPEEERYYTPDFLLSNGIYIEVKGLFVLEDRKKHLLIREQYPEIDIRFVFQNANNKIAKGSKTSYADWCDKHGFKWSHRSIPLDWLN